VPLLVFLVWSYSFRVGMLLAVVGGALYAGMSMRGLWLLAGGGLYLASAYVPFVGYSPRYCGILGTASSCCSWPWCGTGRGGDRRCRDRSER